MTAPASLYAMEMAKRKLSLPKATGCPRVMDVAEPETPVVRRTRTPNPVVVERRARRNRELIEWYNAGLTLEQVARRSTLRHGRFALGNIGSLSRTLRALGVKMRTQGKHQVVVLLRAEVKRLRKRLAMYEPASMFAEEQDEEAA